MSGNSVFQDCFCFLSGFYSSCWFKSKIFMCILFFCCWLLSCGELTTMRQTSSPGFSPAPCHAGSVSAAASEQKKNAWTLAIETSPRHFCFHHPGEFRPLRNLTLEKRNIKFKQIQKEKLTLHFPVFIWAQQGYVRILPVVFFLFP